MPIVHTQHMRDALAVAGKAVDWYVDRDQGHFSGEEGRREYYEHLLGFLSKHIGGVRGAIAAQQIEPISQTSRRVSSLAAPWDRKATPRIAGR